LTTLTLATFNCENLFARYKFNKKVPEEEAFKNGWLANQTHFHEFNKDETRLTAAALKETKADAIALQEVESNGTLRTFRSRYLGGRKKYREYLVIDGNDYLRLIDVGILSSFHIENIRTHMHDMNEQTKKLVFSRDCLECDIVLPDNKRLTLFINHFKSMYNPPDPCNGRAKTHDKRVIQANKVKEIVQARFPNGNGDFVILGDLNDYMDSNSSITDLVNWNKVENVVNRLPSEERWTQYWEGNKKCHLDETYHQLDYILLSKSLAEKNADAIPTIMRKGLPKKAKLYKGPWLKGLGNKAASDHCPVAIKLSI
jgi:predicted extracellular nuclease